MCEVTSRALLGAALLLALPCVADAQSGYTIEKIAASGDPIPGGGTLGPSVYGIDFDDAARVVFWTLQLGGERVFLHDGGSLHEVVRVGDAVPGVPGQSFGFAGNPRLGAGGALAWDGGWGPNPGLQRGIFLRTGGVDTAYLLPGQPVPGGGSFSTVWSMHAMNDANDVAFYAAVDLGSIGLFVARAGAPVQVARNGDAAPAGGVFTGLAFVEPGLAADGTVAFWSELTGGSTPHGAFVRTPGGPISVLLLPGGSVPTPGGGTIEYVGAPVLNASGDVAIALDVLKPGDEYTRAGLYVIEDGSWREIIRRDDPLPGTGGLHLQGLNGHALNEAGEVAFLVSTVETGGQAVFVARNGTIQPVAFEGQAVPGGLPGEKLRDCWDLHLNESGQIAFLCHTTTRQAVFVATLPAPEVPLAPAWALAALGLALVGSGWRRLARR